MEIRVLEKKAFPEQLRQIPSPPERLWLRGNMPPAEARVLTVVGARALTRYGREACQMLIEGLRGYPVSIVSGLAIGADACAHEAALEAGLHTLAIPGSGLSDDVLYPRQHEGLAQEILAAGGGLLSEHEPSYMARPFDFPSRNRLMVGMAHAVLVVEAGERSGTLITAKLAGDYGRDLLCVPHRIGDPNSFGFHLFSRIGAAVVSEPKHLLDALGIAPDTSSVAPPVPLAGPEARLAELLIEPRSRDEIIRLAGLPAHETLALLGVLELKGVAHELLGIWQRIG